MKILQSAFCWIIMLVFFLFCYLFLLLRSHNIFVFLNINFVSSQQVWLPDKLHSKGSHLFHCQRQVVRLIERVLSCLAICNRQGKLFSYRIFVFMRLDRMNQSLCIALHGKRYRDKLPQVMMFIYNRWMHMLINWLTCSWDFAHFYCTLG